MNGLSWDFNDCGKFAIALPPMNVELSKSALESAVNLVRILICFPH
ncbi:hypothetical protein appser13_9930 [Actinobacillus pleuropneumoniae serovar 13 str. N273]|nr:hypothetical protein appser13_9930 [Actinobacillus pleuropneumoniae serovar 13 str. N273]